MIDYIKMDGGVFSGFGAVTTLPGWTVVGAGDINRDGYADVVIENHSTGQIVYANMAGGVFSGFVAVTTLPGWNVVSVEDVKGNGSDDIVIQNPITGQIVYSGHDRRKLFRALAAVATVSGYTVSTGPAPMGDSAVTAGDAAATNVSMLGAGSANTGGLLDGPSDSSTDAGLQSSGAFNGRISRTPITFVDSRFCYADRRRLHF